MFVGSKNVGKEMAKTASGLVRDRGKIWFPELVDSVYIIVGITIILCTQLFRKEYQGPLVLHGQ